MEVHESELLRNLVFLLDNQWITKNFEDFVVDPSDVSNLNNEIRNNCEV